MDSPIRLALAMDLPAMLTLGSSIAAAHRISWADLQIAVRMSNAVVADEAGAVVGMGAAAVQGGKWRILTLAVAPEHRRRRLGTQLVEALVALAPHRMLVVAYPGTVDAARLASAAGFTTIDGELCWPGGKSA